MNISNSPRQPQLPVSRWHVTPITASLYPWKLRSNTNVCKVCSHCPGFQVFVLVLPMFLQISIYSHLCGPNRSSTFHPPPSVSQVAGSTSLWHQTQLDQFLRHFPRCWRNGQQLKCKWPGVQTPLRPREIMGGDGGLPVIPILVCRNGFPEQAGYQG